MDAQIEAGFVLWVCGATVTGFAIGMALGWAMRGEVDRDSYRQGYRDGRNWRWPRR